MLVNVYVIYDKVAEESGPMFQAPNDGIALRMTCNTLLPLPQTLEDDYRLLQIAEYDTKNCQISLMSPREVDFKLSLKRAREWTSTNLEVIKS